MLVASTSMRLIISLSCSREHDRLKCGASVLWFVPSAMLNVPTAVAINFSRGFAWLEGDPPAATRTSRFALLRHQIRNRRRVISEPGR